MKHVVLSILLLINQHCGCFSFYVPVSVLQKCKIPWLKSLLSLIFAVISNITYVKQLSAEM